MRCHSEDSGQERPAFRQRLEELLEGRGGKWRHDGGRVPGGGYYLYNIVQPEETWGSRCGNNSESLAEVGMHIKTKLQGLEGPAHSRSSTVKNVDWHPKRLGSH